VTSVTDVVNVALRRVGAERITSLTDGSKSANVANDIYAGVRDDLLRSHPWNFATKRQQLSQSATAPAFEFDFAYPVPSDWLRTVSVHDNDAGYGTVYYRMEQVGAQRCIVTSASQVWLRYVYRMTDPNAMAADFLTAWEYALAKDFAIPLAGSDTLFQLMEAKARQTLNKARSSDAMGAFPERRPAGSWATSRAGWRNRQRDYLSD